MRRFLLLAAFAAALGLADAASGFERGILRRNGAANSSHWHANYYHAAWGMPVALVVPPTAEYQTQWGWGVGNTRVVPIHHQFQRNYPGPLIGTGGVPLPATPPWPSDTTQFGVYYVRGPW